LEAGGLQTQAHILLSVLFGVFNDLFINLFVYLFIYLFLRAAETKGFYDN